MGVTDFSTSIIDKYLKEVKTKSVIELGSQNLYHSLYPSAPYADVYYKDFSYTCIDLNGENNALTLDLGLVHSLPTYGLVTDFGTSEHVGVNGKHDSKAFYNCWLNKYNMCEVGGIIISENPKTNNWEGHGFNYVTVDFYKGLASLLNCELLEVGEHPAMNNTTNGWNVYSVIKKKSNKFISFSKFKTLDFYTK